jgi:predicted nucleotidyltransferase
MKNKEIMFEKIKDVLIKENAKKIAVFGSYAKNKERKNSDIDIIVEFEDKKSLLDLVGIEQELSKFTKKKK